MAERVNSEALCIPFTLKRVKTIPPPPLVTELGLCKTNIELEGHNPPPLETELGLCKKNVGLLGHNLPPGLP